MTASKPAPETIEIEPDMRVRIVGRDDSEWRFSSRSALEDTLTQFYRAGAAMGWQAGREDLAKVGEIVDVKSVIRGDQGEITGMVTRKLAIPPKRGAA